MLPGREYTGSEFAAMAWRRRWFIVGGLVLGAYVSLVVSSQLQEKFQSEMLIQVIPQRVPDSYVQSTVTMRAEDRLNALSQQVLSRTALEALINELNLYQEPRQRLPMQDVVDQMRTDVQVAPGPSTMRSNSGETDSFHVRFTYPDRQMATTVTERLGRLFIDLNSKDRGQLAQATNDFLESSLAETRRRLEAQEQKLEQFRQRNAGRLPTQLESNMQAIQNTQLSIQSQVETIARDRDRKLMLERLYHDAEMDVTATPASASPIAAPPSGAGQAGSPTPSLRQQLANAQEKLDGLLLRLRPEHPDVGRAKRQVAELEARVAEEAAAGNLQGRPVIAPTRESPELAARRERLVQMRAEIDSLERQIAFKESEEKRMRDTLAQYQRRIEETPGVESEWVALTRDYKTQQEEYENLLAKSEQSKLAVELERRQIGEQFRVLDPARQPVRPTGMNRRLANAMGVAGGLVLGVALAALLEFRDRTFRSVQDIQAVLQLPIVAHVPFVMLDADRRHRRRLRLMSALAVLLVSVVGAYGFWALQLWKFIV